MSRRGMASEEARRQVLEFFIHQGGLCPVAVWKAVAPRQTEWRRAFDYLVQRGAILAPEPGELYVLGDEGYRRWQRLEKKRKQKDA